MVSRRSLQALAFALALAPTAASAQLSDADKATARVLAQQGQDALSARDYATAADRFARAGELVRAPTLTLGLARAQVGLGKLVSAQEAYNRVLRDGAPAGAPPAFARAIVDAKRELAALEPRIPSVIIAIKGASGARVTLDGATVPSAALGVNRLVDPGKHTIRAEAEGFLPAEATVTVAERRAETVTLELRPGRVAEAPPSRSTPPPASAPPTPPTEAPPTSAGSVRKTLGFVGIGVGGAALVLGGVTGGLALKKHGDLASVCPKGHCTGQQGAIDSYHLMATLSTVGFVAGGVLAAAGVVLVVTAPKAKPGGEAWIAPVIGPAFAGAQGRF